MRKYKGLIICLYVMGVFTGCNSPYSATLEEADRNRKELGKVISAIEDSNNDTLSMALSFLLENMYGKYSYQDTVINHYAEYFQTLSQWKELGLKNENDKFLENLWDSLYSTEPQQIGKIPDAQKLTANFLCRNAELACRAWKQRPIFSSAKHTDFYDYVLPYRVAHETPCIYRDSYLHNHSLLRDTSTCPRNFLNAFREEFYMKMNRRIRGRIPEFSYDLPISVMEKGLKGNCHQNAIFCAEVMRSLGIPTAIDYVPAWGNRSSNHEWNVLLLRDDRIYPFNPFETDSAILEYKPAKVLRHTFSRHAVGEYDTLDIPSTLLDPCAEDVSAQYGRTFNIDIDITYPRNNSVLLRSKRHGVICVFDNKEWIPIWYGDIANRQMHFNNMLGDVVYLVAFYDSGKIIPAALPFLLDTLGTMHSLNASADKTTEMTLLRKYPRFKRMTYHAIKVKRSRIEGADNPQFQGKHILYDLMFIPIDTTEIEIPQEFRRKYRYIRWTPVSYRVGDLAEISFYGHSNPDEPIHPLNGNIIGYPTPDPDNPHSYLAAMDGNLETYFSKERDSVGYVGLDLGPHNHHTLTKVRLYPRSDTNYIIPGNTYELFYWKEDKWISAGIQTATCHQLKYNGIPSGSLYWLRNKTSGHEERIFTYEDGEQIWW